MGKFNEPRFCEFLGVPLSKNKIANRFYDYETRKLWLRERTGHWYKRVFWKTFRKLVIWRKVKKIKS